MGRMRVVWGRIWRVLSSHFVDASWTQLCLSAICGPCIPSLLLAEVAAHQNVRVCHYVFRLQRTSKPHNKTADAMPLPAASLWVPASLGPGQAMDSLRQLTMKFPGEGRARGLQLPGAPPSFRAPTPSPAFLLRGRFPEALRDHHGSSLRRSCTLHALRARAGAGYVGFLRSGLHPSARRSRTAVVCSIPDVLRCP